MIELQGKYAKARVLVNEIDMETVGQIVQVLNQPMFENQNIVVQPDCHAGKGCVIGFTSTYTDSIIPNLVGVDIGCGMLWVNIGIVDIDLAKLDKGIRAHIPHGRNVNADQLVHFFELTDLRCYKALKDEQRIYNAVGSLGGGNHFIELAKNEKGEVYVIVHSGSRNLGKQVAEFYQDLAYQNLVKKLSGSEALIAKLKAEGRSKDIAKELKTLHANMPKIDKDLAYLEGQDLEDYLHDVKIVTHYASKNREEIMTSVLQMIFMQYDTRSTTRMIDEMTFKFKHTWRSTIHNYVDTATKIIRKGACRADKGELLLVPINMRDGSLILRGKGIKELNYSAPHGAGRLMSRSFAKTQVKLEDYQATMEGIYSSSVALDTLDESPFAYKTAESILKNIEGVELVEIIKPIYNFKAGGE